MNKPSLTIGLIASALLAGCGGSGLSGGSMGSPGGGPTVTVLSTATIGGSPAFVNAARFAVYVSDGDTTPNVSTCTGGCAAIWPPVAPPGVALTAPWGSFARGDGSTQLSYNGKPLYTFVSDTQPDVASGDGVNGFHLARPLAGTGNGVGPGNPGYNP
ncbi:MAG: hypothetical protein ABI346_09755 [Candidatus Baltobacteraceae bacterium]